MWAVVTSRPETAHGRAHQYVSLVRAPNAQVAPCPLAHHRQEAGLDGMFKIYVGNLSATATPERVSALFSRYAIVDDVAMPIDPETNKPRGFAIVMIKSAPQGRAAMAAARGSRLDGKRLVINEHRKKSRLGARGARPGSRSRRWAIRGGRPPSSGPGGGPGSGGARGFGSGPRPRSDGPGDDPPRRDRDRI